MPIRAGRIRLRRGVTKVSVAPAPLVPAPAAPAPVAAPAPKADGPDAPAAPARQLVEIKSPTPGTFYSRPKPDEDSFVAVGTRVKRDTVVCIIEAMKIFNEIQAECSGVITKVLVQNQQPVEYDQPLFEVDPTA